MTLGSCFTISICVWGDIHLPGSFQQCLMVHFHGIWCGFYRGVWSEHLCTDIFDILMTRQIHQNYCSFGQGRRTLKSFMASFNCCQTSFVQCQAQWILNKLLQPFFLTLRKAKFTTLSSSAALGSGIIFIAPKYTTVPLFWWLWVAAMPLVNNKNIRCRAWPRKMQRFILASLFFFISPGPAATSRTNGIFFYLCKKKMNLALFRVC